MGNRAGRPNQRRSKVRRRLLVERLGERRVLAAITGAVFEDSNHSMRQDNGEANAPSRLIYVDVNDNAQMDVGESFVVAEPDGTFEFPFVEDGTYLLRLFNGTQSQTQTVPVEATIEGGEISIAGATQLELLDELSVALTDSSVVLADSESGSGETVPVGNQLSKIEQLPNGHLLVIGTDAGGDTSWVVDPDTTTVTPVDLSGVGESIPWSDVAIDGNGRGVLLEQTSDLGIIRAIDASGGGLQATTTSNLVPSGAEVATSDTGNRTVFAWSGTDGLQLSLWSNVTASFITSTIDVSGTTGLLSFDDASGLVALRTATGGVSVHDVDANFATLHTMDDVTGPVAIDGERDLLLTVSPTDEMLKVIDLRDGELIADLAIDLSAVGQVASLALNDSADAVVVLGAAGLTEVALRKAAAHEVTVSDGVDPDPVLFGVAPNGNNTAPNYETTPSFETKEDVPLTLAAPTSLNGSSDAESDTYVLVQKNDPANGTAELGIDGSVSYTPNPDFNGTDSLVVMLHDGRDFAEFTLDFHVDPVADTPRGINVDLDPVPEGITPGQRIGVIDIIDADGIGNGGHIITLDDDRFGINGNGEIILIRGPIDFEAESEISIGVSILDTETNETIEEIVAVTITNVNEPITAIHPHEATVLESAPGEYVEKFEVVDEDHQSHVLSVDDDRFFFNDQDELHLKTNVAVDFETEPFIIVNVTAREIPEGGTFSQEVRIQVLDIAEQPETLQLSNQTVMELTPGDVVGDVLLDGGSASGRFGFTVDDSRFEVDGSTLKLVDDQIVERAGQAEIELTITVEDELREFTSVSQSFVIEVLENLTPFHNEENPYDVNHGGDVTAVDALAIINYLNTFGPGPVGQGDPGYCYDVNADGLVTALDALLVLNEINRINSSGGGTVGGEGEDQPNADSEILPAEDTSKPVLTDDRSRQHTDQEVFDDLADQGDAASSDSDQEIASPDIEIPTRSSSKSFADNVDETLRLLSDGEPEV